jgi:hypothetical protein
MPSLFRFLFITGMLAATISGGLYYLAVYHEPAQHEVTKAVPGVKIRKQ